MATPYPVVGIEGTGIQLRLEIRDLQKDPVQFSLFIRALNKVLNMNNSDSQSPDYIEKPNSWWQIAGIHGLPYNPWSGDPKGPQQPDENSQWGGYCYHGSALFPTWHRVVTMLVEQAVVNEAIAIATNLKNDTWLQSAKMLRFPYWDWTKLETAKEGIPQVFQEATVTITNPDGSQTQAPNPLNHYKFTLKPGAASGVEYMNDWGRTYRWANKDVNPTQEMYDQALKAFSEGTTFLLGGQPIKVQPVSWLRSKVAGLFTYDLTLQDPSFGPNMWGYFSNTGAQSDGVEPPMSVMPPSLEESHNMVHLDTGGNGSMSVNEYASYDPIFFMHHANVDRLYAFWEYVYPDYWIADGWKSSDSGSTVPFVTDSGNFGQDANASVDHTTSLLPFRTEALDYWTSDNVRGLLNNGPTQKYYTYPAIKDSKTGVEVKVDVPYDTNDLTLRQQYQQILHSEWSPEIPAILQAHRNLSRAMPQHTNLLMKEENNTAHLRQFVITGALPEFAFPGSHRLELFMLPKDGQQTGGQVVNSISVLSRADPDRCAACKDRRAAGSQIRGNMYLDPRIMLYLLSRLPPDQRAAITELDHLAVLIQGSLGVRLVKPDGTRLAAADPPAGTHHTPLEEAKAPKLTLHSHVIQLKPDAAAVKIGDHTTHGTFREKDSWRAY
ncbi:common central domain of tyrosinase-domain-containing protein [Boletus reticuloceps]|uniref:tyrosinase n=1 Tax=Boletus reticuloceps TaxID=495285 RepID=A0A8I2YWL6_9AGAM|nr:common central domain of tyrosinase-domain-containing protein [Boletus reticuloceps]